MPVFTFCRLFLGEEKRAHDVVLEAFLAHFREAYFFELTELPASLLQCVLEAIKHQCAAPPLPHADGKTLEHAILSLPCEQRAVFILRNVLAVPQASIASATGFSSERVRELWIQALFRLRDLLPENLLKERTQ